MAVIRLNPFPLRQLLNLPSIAILYSARYQAFLVHFLPSTPPTLPTILKIYFETSGAIVSYFEYIIISHQAFFPWPKLLAYGARGRQCFFVFLFRYLP